MGRLEDVATPTLKELTQALRCLPSMAFKSGRRRIAVVSDSFTI
jgi:hypothetical protein